MLLKECPPGARTSLTYLVRSPNKTVQSMTYAGTVVNENVLLMNS